MYVFMRFINISVIVYVNVCVFVFVFVLIKIQAERIKIEKMNYKIEIEKIRPNCRIDFDFVKLKSKKFHKIKIDFLKNIFHKCIDK